jgi:prevent-host-death family protein
MRQAAFTDLRNNAKQYFDWVEKGESVRILRNGKPIADIVPIAPDLPSWKRRKATPLVTSGAGLSALILQERDEVARTTARTAARKPIKKKV